MRTMWIVGLVACALLACAGSSQELKVATAARYKADRQAVFEVARAEVEKEYRAVEYADPVQGLIVSPWRWMDSGGAMKSWQGEGNQPDARARQGDAVFRLAVAIRETPEGIQVLVDGYAQGYEPGTPVAVKYEHGDMREPFWVRGKIESMQIAIHQRLSQVPGVTVVTSKDTGDAAVTLPPEANPEHAPSSATP